MTDRDILIPPPSSLLPASRPSPVQDAGGPSARRPYQSWKADEPRFRDLVDIVNPLNHIPVVSTVYQRVTGDTPGFMSRLIGGTIYGGPIGLIAGLINGVSEAETGNDIGGHVASLVFPRGKDIDGRPAELLAKAPTDAVGAPPNETVAEASPTAKTPFPRLPLVFALTAGTSPQPLRPASATTPQAQFAALPPQAQALLADQGVARAMMQNLEKYDSLMRQRRLDLPAPGTQVSMLR
jgi:hypothetical protein